MKEFKKRCIELLVSVVGGGVLFGILFGVYKLLELIHPAIPEVIVLAAVLVALIAVVAKFIYWLFIEPFRKGRNQ